MAVIMAFFLQSMKAIAGIPVANPPSMNTLKILSGFAVVLFALSSCNSSDGQTTVTAGAPSSVVTATPTATPIPTATPVVDLSQSGLIGTWSLSANGYSGKFIFAADDSITNASDNSVSNGGTVCNQSGQVAGLSLSASPCASGVSQCGNVSLLLTNASGGSSCLAAGSYSCSYTVSATDATTEQLALDCGSGVIDLYERTVQPQSVK